MTAYISKMDSFFSKNYVFSLKLNIVRGLAPLTRTPVGAPPMDPLKASVPRLLPLALSK